MTNLEKIHPDVIAVSKSKLVPYEWAQTLLGFNTQIKESLRVLRPEKQRCCRAKCHEKFSGTWSLSVEYVQKVSPS